MNMPILYRGIVGGLAGGLKEDRFDPEGNGYDTAEQVGSPMQTINPEDNKLHWFSLNPRTGMVLKGRKHPTWDKMLEVEEILGNEIIKRSDGRYYSRKKKKE